MEIEKNAEYIGVITSLGVNGEGIIKKNGYTVFIPYALPTERVRFKVLKVKKNYAFGKIVQVLTPADERVRPKCPVFTKCGGCQMQHVKYSYQLKYKTKAVQDCFSKIAGIDYPVAPCIKSDQDWEYRNKLQIPVVWDEKGDHVGFFAENSHRVVDIDACFIHPAWSATVISAIKKYMEITGVHGYNETTRQGLLRHVVVRDIDGKLLIVLVINGETLPQEEVFLSLLKEKIPDFSCYINVNTDDTNVVTGERYRCIYGKPRYTAEEFGITYEAGPNTFLQVNGDVKKKIYDRAIRLAGINADTDVIDAYSGAGIMTAMCAKVARKAYGIEIVPEAVDCANHLAERNGLLGKMENICGACEEVLPPLVEKIRAEGHPISVILDPPRKGAEESVLHALLHALPDRIVYISCNPATLARDVGILTDTLVRSDGELKKNPNPVPKYEIVFLQPYDMFAQTKHVETLVCLSKKTEKHINIDVEFGEGEGQVSLKKLQEELNEQKPKKKTTYKDIQAYIEEKYGFKVHTAYIAEVKRDLGLPMYDAPNAVEELKRPRSHPTAEMVEAIKDALKHFEII